MVTDKSSKVEIDIDDKGELFCLMCDIARSLESIKDSLELANQLKAEELVRQQKAASLNDVHELLVEHWKYINDHR